MFHFWAPAVAVRREVGCNWMCYSLFRCAVVPGIFCKVPIEVFTGSIFRFFVVLAASISYSDLRFVIMGVRRGTPLRQLMLALKFRGRGSLNTLPQIIILNGPLSRFGVLSLEFEIAQRKGYYIIISYYI